jgi:hypothetical protein
MDVRQPVMDHALLAALLERLARSLLSAFGFFSVLLLRQSLP